MDDQETVLLAHLRLLEVVLPGTHLPQSAKDMRMHASESDTPPPVLVRAKKNPSPFLLIALALFASILISPTYMYNRLAILLYPSVFVHALRKWRNLLASAVTT